ncbi:hypothetical protein VULLAG_LOCUS9419 [Vulpes lagopus]
MMLVLQILGYGAASHELASATGDTDLGAFNAGDVYWLKPKDSGGRGALQVLEAGQPAVQGPPRGGWAQVQLRPIWKHRAAQLLSAPGLIALGCLIAHLKHR